MAKVTKKTSKLSRIKRIFNPSSPKGKLLIFMAVFAILGGGYMTYKSFAYSLPPSNLRDYRAYSAVTASDGHKGDVHCRSVTGQTGYGPLGHCDQYRGTYPNITVRYGWYSPITKGFSPTTGWAGTETNIPSRGCSNMNYYFTGKYAIYTGYGPLSYGQIYRYYGGKWQVKWATFSTVHNSCSPWGNWMDAKPL